MGVVDPTKKVLPTNLLDNEEAIDKFGKKIGK
jgi:hypothetical protein